MPRGIGDISDLRLSVLNGVIEQLTSPPELMLGGMFPSMNAQSETIEWESYTGGRGLTPFKAPGSPTPVTAPLGYKKHSAQAAFWGEKMYFDEQFLNNLRKLGTRETYQTAQQKLARELAAMTNKCRRRKEWMFAKMITAGSFNYLQTSGYKASVDYQIPSANEVTLGAAYKWGTGPNKDIIGDVIAGKRVISDSCGANVTMALINSVTLEYMARDVAIQTLLQKSAFGDGNLFKNGNKIVGANPNIIGSLLNIPKLVVYDEVYEVRAMITSTVSASATTIYVDDISDFSTGTLVIKDVSANTSEEVTISAVNVEASTLTVSATESAYKAGEDIVVQKVKFVPDNKFIMVAERVEGQPIAEYMAAPYGINRGWGLRADRDETWDPEGVWIRVQDKGLPVLYFRDAVYILTVE